MILMNIKSTKFQRLMIEKNDALGRNINSLQDVIVNSVVVV